MKLSVTAYTIRIAAGRGTRARSQRATSGVNTKAMISPRMKGNSTALAQTTKETASAALMAKKTMRGRVQPPAGRPIGGVFKLTGLDTKPPNVGHNVDVPDKQALACASAPHQASRRVKPSANHHFRATPTKRNEPESATFVAHPGSLVLHRGPRPLEERAARASQRQLSSSRCLPRV